VLFNNTKAFMDENPEKHAEDVQAGLLRQVHLACVVYMSNLMRWAQDYTSHSAVQTVSIPVHMLVQEQLH
jgi:hypothetical protein